MSAVKCYHCGNLVSESEFGRRDSCAKCARDTRVCRNCKNFDPTRNNQCREEQAPRQVEKEKANFCEWFQPGGAGASGGGPSKESLKAAAEALFKKKS